MNDQPQLDDHQTLNLETGRLTIKELLPFFASGSMIRVVASLDLVNVAVEFKADNKEQVEQWLSSGEIALPSNEEAKRWQKETTAFWALVVSPWVLAQEIQSEEDDEIR